MKKTMGRPRIDIDQFHFESLCEIQCTKEEVCQFFHISDSTLERWCKRTYNKTFEAVFGEKRGNGLISLRRSGFRLAEKNAAVWIFMAKNYLGMKDQPDLEDGQMPPQPVSINFVVEDASKK